jgi:hypothetical protein
MKYFSILSICTDLLLLGLPFVLLRFTTCCLLAFGIFLAENLNIISQLKLKFEFSTQSAIWDKGFSPENFLYLRGNLKV